MIGVVGAGAFGTALAVALGREGRTVTLWARDAAQVQAMSEHRRNLAHLPEADLPQSVSVTAEIADLTACRTILLAVPMQSLAAFLQENGAVRA